MSKLAHSNDQSMIDIEFNQAVENGDIVCNQGAVDKMWYAGDFRNPATSADEVVGKGKTYEAALDDLRRKLGGSP